MELEDFKEFYKKENVVGSYDRIRLKGLKEGVNRQIELGIVNSIVKKGKILEIGPGTGFFTQLLEKKGKVTAIDTSSKMIALAKTRAKKAKFIVADLFDYSPKEKFDYVVAFRVLGHLNNSLLGKALQKISSFAKKGGIIIFNVENKSLIRKVIRFFRRKRVETYQLSIEDLKKMVGKTALEIERVIPTDHFFLLFPLFIMNKILFGRLRGFILRAEENLFSFPYLNANWIVKCRKK